jgi:hypothetical protein
VKPAKVAELGYDLSKARKVKTGAVPYKQGGGSNPNDFVNPHAEKHMYDSNITSKPNRTQYRENVDVGKLRQETINNPDKCLY